MRVSREQMVANKARILNEASKLFRERGFDSVSVADVMKAAGQTHGGFYGHFASKDDLIAQTVAHAMAAQSGAPPELSAWIDAYLSSDHCKDAANGCPVAGFAGLLRQQTPAARAALAQGLRAQLDSVVGLVPQGDAAARRREAIGRWSAMVGALVMARAVDDDALADELLSATRTWMTQPTAVDSGGSTAG